MLHLPVDPCSHEGEERAHPTETDITVSHHEVQVLSTSLRVDENKKGQKVTAKAKAWHLTSESSELIRDSIQVFGFGPHVVELRGGGRLFHSHLVSGDGEQVEANSCHSAPLRAELLCTQTFVDFLLPRWMILIFGRARKLQSAQLVSLPSETDL